MSIFPLYSRCDRGNGWSDHDFSELFHKHRKDRTWYGYDVIVHSRTSVSFVAYDLDYHRSCVGDEIFRIGPLDVPFKLTNKIVERKIRERASDRFAAEQFAAEKAVLERYADEIRNMVDMLND